MDVLKLKGKFVENEISAPKMAQILGIDVKTLYRKLRSGKFTVGEAQKMKNALSLTNEEAIQIFLS